MDESFQLENALGQAFSGQEPPKAPAPPPPPEPVEEPAPVEAEAEAAPTEEEPAAEEAPAPEPEFEIEVDGKPETIRGADAIKEHLAKGLKAGRMIQENAHVREALVAQRQAMEVQAKFQQAIIGDFAELRALDQQLEQWSRVDWNAAYESDPFNALKLREQRDALKEKRQAKFQELQGKHQQFIAMEAETRAKSLAAEHAALTAKVPEWRNSETAQREKAGIANMLAESGFSQSEIQNLSDHRLVALARELLILRQQKSGAAQKQVRAATPTAKPGVPQSPTQKARSEFKQERAKLREMGSKGNHKAQENILERMLSKTFTK